MERQVIFRDRQELPAIDFNNVQAFTDESLQHIVQDAITSERMYVGFNVTVKSATELDIAAGRLWDGGAGTIYAGGAQTLSVFSNLPVQDEKWLAVSVRGQTEELDLQPRDFLIDLQTNQTEPSTVAMEQVRTVATHITAGLESPRSPRATCWSPMSACPPTAFRRSWPTRMASSCACSRSGRRPWPTPRGSSG